MDQSFDKIIRDDFIFQNMHLIERMARRYAYKNKRHPEECVAEAYYQLTVFMHKKMPLYLSSENPVAYLKTSIIREMRRYFTYREEQFGIKAMWKALGKSEQDMYDILEYLDPGNKQIIRWMREGFEPDDLMFWSKQYRKKISLINKKRKQILKNVIKVMIVENKVLPDEVLNFAGIPNGDHDVGEGKQESQN